MVFPSLPLYLDPPNWQQQHPNQQLIQSQNNYHDQNQHRLVPPQLQPQPQPSHQLGIAGGIGPAAHQIRPNSMAEEARRRKLPPPNGPIKCPRCDSINTKFCYYNNYNLSQPRHFCKTCRRYWTQGGALRNVPVGGGCRRNKRSTSKSSSSGGPTSSSKPSLSSTSTMGIPSGSNMPFMASLQNMVQLGQMSNMGLTFSGGPINTNPRNINPPGINPGGFERGAGEGNNNHNHLRFPQLNQTHVSFPNFLGGFQIPGSFQNDNDNHNHNHNHNQGIIGDGDDDDNDNDLDRHQQEMSEIDLDHQQVKIEENGQQGLNIANQMMLMRTTTTSSTDNNNGNNQYWGGNNNETVVTSMWTDLSGLNSSSTTHLL